MKNYRYGSKVFEEAQVFGKSKDSCPLGHRLRNKDGGNADKVRSRM